MKTVYVVEQGEYSDRGVVGIAGTEEIAKLWVDLINEVDRYDQAVYSEYDVMTGKPRVARVYSMLGGLDSNGRRIHWGGGAYGPEEDHRFTASNQIVFERSGFLKVTMPNEQDRYLHVIGENEKRVKKVFYDRLAQLEAEHAGIA